MSVSPLRAAALACALGSGTAPAPDGVERRFRFPEAFLGFRGHFPGSPVLPAFVQVLLAHLVAEEAAGRPLQLRALSKAKFLAQVKPGQEVAVRCLPEGEGADLTVKAALSADGAAAAAFVLLFGEAPR